MSAVIIVGGTDIKVSPSTTHSQLHSQLLLALKDKLQETEDVDICIVKVKKTFLS